MFGNSSEQMLAPHRSQSSDSTGFNMIQVPNEKYFQTDLNNCVYIPSP